MIHNHPTIVQYKADKLRSLMFQSIVRMLKFNKKFKYVTKKHQSVDRYLNYFKECTYIKINNIYESKEVQRDFLREDNKKYIPIYHNILRNLLSGKGIRNYLSKEVLRLKPDGLYNDWGILHLHFDTNVHSKQRTTKLLLIRIYNKNAYVLKIIEHGINAFTNKHYLRILYNNWPNTLNTLNKPYVSKAQSINQNHINISKFRKLGVNQPYTIHDDNGRCVTILGNGYNLTSSIVMRDWKKIREMSSCLLIIFSKCKRHLYNKNLLNSGYFIYDIKSNMFQFYSNNVFPTNKNHFIFQFSSMYILNLLHDKYIIHNHHTKIMINPEYIK